jgi:hypothetical protein
MFDKPESISSKYKIGQIKILTNLNGSSERPAESVDEDVDQHLLSAVRFQLLTFHDCLKKSF